MRKGFRMENLKKDVPRSRKGLRENRPVFDALWLWLLQGHVICENTRKRF